MKLECEERGFGHIAEGLDKLRESRYVSKETIGLHKDILRVQHESKLRLSEENVFGALSEEEVLRKIKEGTPLLNFEDLQIEEGELWRLYDEIYLIMNCHTNGGVEICHLKEEKKDLDIKDLVKRVACHDRNYLTTISKRGKMSEPLLMFISANILKPFFELAASNLKDKLRDDLWLQSYCPICGNSPLMARLRREEGRRILQCYLCSTEWWFRRIKCVSCGNDDQKTLRFFIVEDSSPYRVDICDKCKVYIKTIDERKIPEDKRVSLFIEDIATTHLDVLAAKEGYMPVSFIGAWSFVL